MVRYKGRMSWGSASWSLVSCLALALGCGRADGGRASSNGEAGSGGVDVAPNASGGAGLGGDSPAGGGGASSGGLAMGGTTTVAGAAGSGGEAAPMSASGAGGTSGAAGFCSTVHHVEIPLNLFNVQVSSARFTIGRVGERFSVVEEGTTMTGDNARAMSLVSWQGSDAHWECTSGCLAGYATIITPDVGGPQMLLEDSTYAKAWDTSGNLLGSTLLYFPEVANISQGVQTTGAQYQFKTSKDGRRALWAFGYANFSPVTIRGSTLRVSIATARRRTIGSLCRIRPRCRLQRLRSLPRRGARSSSRTEAETAAFSKKSRVPSEWRGRPKLRDSSLC